MNPHIPLETLSRESHQPPELSGSEKQAPRRIQKERDTLSHTIRVFGILFGIGSEATRSRLHHPTVILRVYCREGLWT